MARVFNHSVKKKRIEEQVTWRLAGLALPSSSGLMIVVTIQEKKDAST